MTNEIILLIVIICLFGVAFLRIKIMLFNEIRVTQKLINNLELTLKNEIAKRLDKEEHV